MTSTGKKERKLITIVVATYNCGRKVDKTLRSIFSQNRSLFEVIVVDGASTDDTLEFIREYAEDLHLISERDEGVYHAFNKALGLASGKYVYFIGAGDTLKPNILEEIKDFLLPELADFVYGRCFFAQSRVLNGGKFTSESFIKDNLCQQGIFYHRRIFETVGKFDVRYRVFADWFFNLKCFLHRDITEQYIDFVIADYEEGGISSRIKNDPVFMRDFAAFVRKKFGISQFIACKLFLNFPNAFHYARRSEYKSLIALFVYRYALPRCLLALIKPLLNIHKH